MTIEQYTTRTGAVQYRPVMNEQEYREADDDNMGFCLYCGVDTDGVEPDGRKYTCQACGQNKVYGIPELLLMGLVKLVD